MIYALIENGTVTDAIVTDENTKYDHDTMAEYKSRHDWDMETSEKIAEHMTAKTGEVHVAVDKGNGCWPRHDVIRAPAVGDEVSYGFNGDYYPCGVITAVSKTLQKVTTDTGAVFRRRKQSASWMKPGGTWSLVQGHHRRWNPEF